MPVISGVIWDFAEHYHIDDTSIAWNESGTLDSSGFVIEGPLTLGIRYYPELPGWAFDNGWHNSIMMAYADDYRPDTLSGPCTPGTDCLTIANTGGIRNDKVSLLVIAGTNDWSDVDTNGFFDDPESVFDIGNEDLNSDFDARAVGGNDHLLVMEEI
jgi:hypothetical protein